MKTKIESAQAPKAIGPYSPGIDAGSLVAMSGQIPVNPESGKIEAEDAAGQARQSLMNVQALLDAANLGFDNVVKTTVYLADMNDFADVNAVYAEFFTEPYPARSCVAVAALPMGAKVEIEVLCVK